ncbi:protein N-terminal and lysine N-methyltransferase efm7 [Aristolochia californica]|uniref:protein N-terminal and lysine N-methyltransferase efm7 n=1 Tax=Aristolochia californica TaxID=171875 RepID=UPI0035D60844
MDIALFSPSSLFVEDEDRSPEVDGGDSERNCVERSHAFPEMDLLIREFSFHQLNANLLWPGTFAFAKWLVQNHHYLEGRRIIELGSGTGALAIFLRKSFEVDITTSDYDDMEIEENIGYNCRANGLAMLPHIRHSWGALFPMPNPHWNLVIASDILLYVKQYANLIKTLLFLLKSYKPKDCKTKLEGSGEQHPASGSGGNRVLPEPAFLMSWRRRIGKEDEAIFFSGCEDAGLKVEHLGSRIYCISPINT